ncbi:MAG: isoleucine--tRNA ligase, partial [Duodenibacillus sp.]|nr:isoleucine--tRNA ligase [Duodenibacillus sp.]
FARHELPAVEGAEALLAKWAQVRSVRAEVLKAIETLREEGKVGSGLQAECTISACPADYAVLSTLGEELRFVAITSRCDVVKAEGEATTVAVRPSAQAKCQRCWHYVPGVGADAEHPEICPRCSLNLFGAGEKRLFA